MSGEEEIAVATEAAQKGVDVVDLKEKFHSFLRSYRDRQGRYKYIERLKEALSEARKSIPIDFQDLNMYDRRLARIVINSPEEALDALSSVATEIASRLAPEVVEEIGRIQARIRGLLESVRIRDIRSDHIGKLIQVEGILVRATPVRQYMETAVFKCTCGNEVVKKQEGLLLEPPEYPCEECGKTSWRLVVEKSKFIDWQRIVIQERPEEVPSGQLPRSIEGIVRGDLVDTARPGDRVSVVGILRVAEDRVIRKGTKIVFEPVLETVHIDVSQKALEEIEISKEDEEKILQLSRDPWIHTKIVNSIAPTIYGHQDIKKAIALALFGGVPKTAPDGSRIRGDIHVLLIGDPGTGKSMLLQYVSRIAPRGIYTTGKGASAAGITAAVVRDKRTGEFYLEAGALVLADGGIACIDEIDKMREEDRTAIHEALEQQSYHRDFELMLADGSKVKIGELVDELIEKNRDLVIEGRDTEILPVRGLYLIGYDPYAKRTIIVSADRVSRHKAPDRFYRITFSNGRSIVVTPEHPIVVWSNGDFSTVEAERIKPGTLVPAVRRYSFLGVDEDLSYGFLRRSNAAVNVACDGGEALEDETSRMGRIPPIAYRSWDVARHILSGLKRGQDREASYFEVESVELAEDVQDLLLTLGISSRIVRRERPPYRVVIPNSRDKELLTAFLSGECTTGALNEDEDGNVRLLKVEKVEVVENYDSEWVYDVTVEPYHLFVSHGLILHNTVSIAKAGIVARLNARCAVIAAGNPTFGRYIEERPVTDNINLPVTILSRFDLIFILRDKPEPSKDSETAEHILKVHKDISRIRPEIDPELLRKYISYARRYVTPRISDEALERLKRFYVDMRRKSAENPEVPIAITARQLEALVRLAEAHARMGLREEVTVEDAEEAIRLMRGFLEAVGLDTATGMIDIDLVMTGKSRSQQEKLSQLVGLISEMQKEVGGLPVKVKDVMSRATAAGLEREWVEKAIRTLRREGTLYEPRPGYISVVK